MLRSLVGSEMCIRDRCQPPAYVVVLEKALLDSKQEEHHKITKLQKEKEEAIERNAVEWKRAIRKAAKRINRDPDTPASAKGRCGEMMTSFGLENVPPPQSRSGPSSPVR
eukprot:TRINITY_DN6503_c0_g1_i1.p1 TRINITY_DN6503_c0_g1~~TRINITY_DN6503_c0_g1_i1.p1  ORF type:complete len:110 (-),score=38.14 TRINITY_DN6503_c0_g1_i1:344-673(-)